MIFNIFKYMEQEIFKDASFYLVLILLHCDYIRKWVQYLFFGSEGSYLVVNSMPHH